MPNSSVFHLMISTAKLSQEGGKIIWRKCKNIPTVVHNLQGMIQMNTLAHKNWEPYISSNEGFLSNDNAKDVKTSQDQSQISSLAFSKILHRYSLVQ